MELMPNSRVPYNAAMMPVIQLYYNLGKTEKANAIVREYSEMVDQELTYYEGLMRAKPGSSPSVRTTTVLPHGTCFRCFSLANSFEQKEMAQELMAKLQAHNADFPGNHEYAIDKPMLIVRPPYFITSLMPRMTWGFYGQLRKVFLTFDDGPTPGVTPWVLDQLRQYNAKATFFCLGQERGSFSPISTGRSLKKAIRWATTPTVI